MSQNLSLPDDQRRRDFALRAARGRVPAQDNRTRRSHRGRRAAVLLAVIAVPTLAAPNDWRPFDIGNAGQAQVVIEPMPFERAGDSFPGSAFYYLATGKELARGGEAGLVADAVGGPIARAMRMDFSGVDRSRAIECLTAAVYYEASSESDQGQRSVAQVVLNRVAHPAYPDTVCGVVYQGSERSTGCQFTFTCDGSLARRPNPMFWQRAHSVAVSALAGYVEPGVGLATHYHAIAIHPYWAPSLNHIVTVGAHRFYSFRGRAGSAGTFRFAYGGDEPLAAPHSRNALTDGSPDPTLDPLALQRTYNAGLASTQPRGGKPGAAALRPAAAPVYAPEVHSRGGDALYRGDKLPAGLGTIRPEYKDSGRWIGQPGG